MLSPLILPVLAATALTSGAVQDHRAASQATVQIGCTNDSGVEDDVSRPSTCGITASGDVAGGATTVYFNKLKWLHWGSATATATGRGAFHGDSPKVSVRVSKLNTCGNIKLYTRFAYKIAGHTTTVTLSGCIGEGA